MSEKDTLIYTTLPMLLQLGLQAFVVVLLIVNRRRFKEFFKTGIVIAVIACVMNLPFFALLPFMMDVGKFMGRFAGSLPGGGSALNMESFFRVLMFCYYMVVVVETSIIACLSYVAAAAEWGKLRPRPFPLIMRTGEKAWRRIGIASLIGVGSGFVSLVFVRLLNVHESDMMRELFSSSFPLPPVLDFTVSLLVVSAAALTEELLFRGALLGFLFRVSRDRLFPLLASVFAVSIVWALMHLPNTDSPLFKVTQILLLGLVLAEVTRRWSLESAIALHFSLNLTSIILEYAKVF